MSLQKRPRLFTNSTMDRVGGHSEHLAQRLHGHKAPIALPRTARVPVKSANLKNVSLAENSGRNALSARRPVSAFGYHVSYVFGLRPKEEVVRANAISHVALVKNAKPVGNGAIGDSPGRSVDHILAAVVVPPVSFWVELSNPKPTASGLLLNKRPETCRRAGRSSYGVAHPVEL